MLHSERCTAEEWTLCYWHRTAAVQCCHQQPCVDKMIPIYFDNPNSEDICLISQMFISDKAGKGSNKKSTTFITRMDPTIECWSPLPFIALLLDLNHDAVPNLSVSFNKQRHHKRTDRCLCIYASGLSHNTFSFLHHSQSEVEGLLKSLISNPKESLSDSRLDGLMRYGDSVKRSHMMWHENRGSSITNE